MTRKRKAPKEEIVVLDDSKTEYFEDGLIVIRTVYKDEGDYVWEMFRKSDDWKYVDDLVMTFQKKFEEGATTADIEAADNACMEILTKFKPLISKYYNLIVTGQINFKNAEQRQFVRLFVSTKSFGKAFKAKNLNPYICEHITNGFNFVVEGYGKLSQEEILSDMNCILIHLAKRYKNVGRSFCCYVYNLFKYEMCRLIQKFNKDPANFHYKKVSINELYETGNMTDKDEALYIGSHTDDESFIDRIAEDSNGMLNASWIKGETCSDIFKDFSPMERLIFSKYYLQEWTYDQIANFLNMPLISLKVKHLETMKKFCEKMGIDYKDLPRRRNSKKKSFGYIELDL